MIKNEMVTLFDGQTAWIIKGKESGYKNCYIVRLKNGELRVVDQETLALAETLQSSSYYSQIHFKKKPDY